MKKKYIKDYVPKEDGSYEYRGVFFVYSKSEKEQKTSGRVQIFYGIFTLLVLFLVLCFPAVGTRTLYVVLPLEIMMICFVSYVMGSVELVKTHGKMERRVYDKAWEGPMQTITISMILEFFSILGQLVGVLAAKRAVMWDWIMEVILLLHLIATIPVWNRQRREIKMVKEGRE